MLVRTVDAAVHEIAWRIVRVGTAGDVVAAVIIRLPTPESGRGTDATFWRLLRYRPVQTIGRVPPNSTSGQTRDPPVPCFVTGLDPGAASGKRRQPGFPIFRQSRSPTGRPRPRQVRLPPSPPLLALRTR